MAEVSYSVSTRSIDAQIRDITITNYVLDTELASTNCATLFRGTFLQEKICIKQYKADSKQTKSKKLLIEEARTMQRVAHPNIVRLIGIDLPRMRIVMPLEGRFVGGSEQQWINNVRQLIELEDYELTIKDRNDVLLAVAKAMSHMHSLEVLHLDLKSQNVLVCETSGKI